MLKIDDDIIMKDCTNTYNYNNFNFFRPYFSNYIRPHKRSYLEMLYHSKKIILNNRIDNYKLSNKSNHNNSLLNQDNKEEKNNNILSINFDNFNNINKAKKNLMVKKKIEYDEEREKRWVENYYKIKNAELNRLRFDSV